MRSAYCTYCSGRKRSDAGVLPAIERYDSERISRVEAAARAVGCRFYILSGEFGLLAPETPIPWYDHRLAAHEVEAVARQVAGQIIELGIGHLTYFTVAIEDEADVRPYLDAITGGCQHAEILMEISVLASSQPGVPPRP